ncbi:MAG TPA: hypothetical protein VNM72_06660 [Blastocatellia bacterium]|nr:hypothetical protein [Blastocatellia bacterium]
MLAVRSSRRAEIVFARWSTSSQPVEELGDFVLQARENPPSGPPRQPQVIYVASASDAESLRQKLPPEIVVEVSAKLPEPDVAAEQSALTLTHLAHLNTDYRTQATLAGESLSEDDLRAFFRIAADFYRHEPWFDIDEDEVLEIEIRYPDRPSHSLYSMLSGTGGEDLTLVLFRSFEELEQYFEHAEERMRAMEAVRQIFDAAPLDPVKWKEERRLYAKAFAYPSVNLTYAFADDVPPSLLEEAEELRIPLNLSGVFPHAVAIGNGRIRTATATDLHHLSAAMKAILNWAEEIKTIEAEEELRFIASAEFPALMGFPPATTRTTLKINPFAYNLEMLIEELEEEETILEVLSLMEERNVPSSRPPKKPASRKKKATRRKRPPKI